MKEYNHIYHKTDKGKKRNAFSHWKGRGVKEYGYTFDELYEYYKECNNCEVCGKSIFITTKQQHDTKCLDHCHETGCFRWVLCHSCNTRDRWMKIYCPS